MYENGDLANRLRLLERRQRWLCGAVAALICILATNGCRESTTPEPDKAATPDRIELKDDQGRKRVVIGQVTRKEILANSPFFPLQPDTDEEFALETTCGVYLFDEKGNLVTEIRDGFVEASAVYCANAYPDRVTLIGAVTKTTITSNGLSTEKLRPQ